MNDEVTTALRFAASAKHFECAREQGRAGAMHDTLFARQEEIGRTSWDDFAAAAGVPDSRRFDACMRGDAVAARVREDAHLSRELGLEGTPMLLVGNAVVFGGMSPDSLRALVRAARAR
jgi:protein-disulfide isomerase